MYSSLQYCESKAHFSYDERRWFAFDNAGHADQNSSAHVAHVVGLQTDAVVVTETHLNYNTARKKRPRYAITYQIVLISLKAFIALKLNIVLS